MRQLFRQSIFSALARHRLLLGVVVLVTLIQITVSLWGIQAVQQQVVHSVSAIVQSRVAQLENNFASLSGNLKRRLVTQTQLSLFEQALSENTLERIQARHQHSQTGGHAARSPPDHLITAATAAGPALPDACADPGVQLLRNGGGLIFFSCTLEFVHN